MANAMNLVGYDAAALGNHEFNYGLDTLRTFESQLNFPLLGANAVDPATGRPVFPPYVIKRFKVHGGPDLKVGVLGLTNPGIAIWDKANVEGRVEFPGLVEQARRFVPELKRRGCDVVVISAHSGADTSSSYGDALPWPENAASLVAEQVPGVDAILVGHAHREIPERFVTNTATGEQVLLCEPLYWGMRVAVMDLDLQHHHGRWKVVARPRPDAQLQHRRRRPRRCSRAVRRQHETVVDYVNSPVGTSAAALSAARAVVEDVPIIDFVQYVQADAVKAGLTGADAALPVLSIAAPFNRAASFPAGQVTVRDVAGLYIYDNTLLGVKVTGAQVKDYLEYSARYFQQVSGTGPFTMAQVTNAGHRHRTERHARLQLRHRRRARRPADVRHRHRPAGRLAHPQPVVRRPAGRGGPGVRDGGQQLPPVRRRRLPAREHGAGRLQPAERDPPAAHRLGDRPRHDRPGRVRLGRLAARVGRPADHGHLRQGRYELIRTRRGSSSPAPMTGGHAGEQAEERAGDDASASPTARTRAGRRPPAPASRAARPGAAATVTRDGPPVIPIDALEQPDERLGLAQRLPLPGCILGHRGGDPGRAVGRDVDPVPAPGRDVVDHPGEVVVVAAVARRLGLAVRLAVGQQPHEGVVRLVGVVEPAGALRRRG